MSLPAPGALGSSCAICFPGHDLSDGGRLGGGGSRYIVMFLHVRVVITSVMTRVAKYNHCLSSRYDVILKLCQRGMDIAMTSCTSKYRVREILDENVCSTVLLHFRYSIIYLFSINNRCDIRKHTTHRRTVG